MPVRRVEPNRWSALLLLLGVLGVSYLLVLQPLFATPLAEVEARIGELQVRNARLRSLLLLRPQIERRLADLNAQGNSFLPQPSAELATAALVQQLEQVVGEASPGGRGCAIVNREPLADERSLQEPYKRVTVQVRLRCGNAETFKVLHALESARPYVFVDQLQITAQRYFAVPGSVEPQEGGLDVSFNLYGYVLPSAEAARGR
ncbi:MAG: general secretion pathway protein GspM [Thermomonas sp.]|nr:general secretion pathway protein GspM [Thermomonas sp.]